MRTCAGIASLLVVLGLHPLAQAAPPKSKPAAPLPRVDADILPAGQFAGVLASAPNSDRMITLKITYPEVRLKPGAKMPNLKSMEARTMQQILQDMHRAQQMPHARGGYGGGRHHHYNALNNMMQQQQRYMQGQQRMAQAMARAQQREVQLLQQEIKAIQNMFQVVPVTRDFDFQLTENVKVRIKDLPENFDEKGNIKRYTAEEKAALKGKDKNLMGYESSVDALTPGQTVLVALRVHKKPKATTVATPAAGKDKEEEKPTVPMEPDASVEHKMQVTVLVILKDGNAPPPSSAQPKKKNKK